MRKEETACRKVWTAVKRRDAATLLASVGRMRCACRLVRVMRAALVVQRASRAVWKSTSELGFDDGVGRPKFDFHTGRASPASSGCGGRCGTRIGARPAP